MSQHIDSLKNIVDELSTAVEDLEEQIENCSNDEERAGLQELAEDLSQRLDAVWEECEAMMINRMLTIEKQRAKRKGESE
jgi:hypothetical protein